MKRRIMAWILGLAMLISMLPAPAIATEADIPVEVSDFVEETPVDAGAVEQAPPQVDNSAYYDGPELFEESMATAVPTVVPTAVPTDVPTAVPTDAPEPQESAPAEAQPDAQPGGVAKMLP